MTRPFLADIVRTIAAFEWRNLVTLSVYARAVRQDGLVPTHGRGRSSARMTTRDAAVTLIGLNCTMTAQVAGPNARGFMALKNQHVRTEYEGLSPALLPVLHAETLVDAIEALIVHIHEDPSVKATVVFNLHAPAARIVFSWAGASYCVVGDMEYDVADVGSVYFGPLAVAPGPGQVAPDHTVEFSFGSRMLRAVAALFRDGMDRDLEQVAAALN